MLKLILGRAGSGKTEYLRTELKRLAQQEDGKLMLIVPEQASFENERAMLRLLGAENARRVSVTSFSRLADAVFRRYGGFAGRRLDDGGRGMFMSLALEQVKDKLNFYRKNAESTELVNLMLDVSAEFKMCTVCPENISAAAENMPQGTLKQKMTEISLILFAYDALVSRSCVDPLDDLTTLKNILNVHDFFSGYKVMIDSFQSFTVQEYDIINLILAQAIDLTVTLCTDTLDDPEGGVGLFSVVRRTGKRLMRLAKQNNVKISAPTVLKSPLRFQNSALAALEAGAYRPAHTVYENECSGVEIYEAKNVYDEVSFVCATIRGLVIHENYRYRDFAVIARSPDSYRGVLDTALQRWEIPYFMDKPEEIDAQPLMRLVLCALKIAQYGFRSDDVFLYLKTGLAGLSTEQISQLENYVFVWNISGKKWIDEWADNPQGFAEKMTQQDAAALKEINLCRKTVTRPLEKLTEKTADTNGVGMAAAVYGFLQDIGAAEKLKTLAKKISESGEPALAQKELRVWDLLMNILDQTALVLGETPITRARYAELLHLVINSSRLASIPQGLDEVTVGAANRTRTNEPKVVFIIGAVQGEFPLTPGGGCVFSDSERRELIRLGLPLNDTMEGVAVQERFLAYSAMSAASQRLYISYPVSNAEGKANSPSSILTETCSVLKKISVKNELLFSPDYFANAGEPAFEIAARKWNSNDEFSATLKKIFNSGEKGARLAAVERAAERKPARFSSGGKALELFGGDMRVSATQIETFYLCRFQYFCRYGLNAQELRAAELNALEYGSLMHFLLEKMFKNIGSKKISEMSGEELKSKILYYLNIYAETKLGGLQNRTPRFSYLVSRLADSAQIVILHIAEELEQSEFSPADFELKIGGEIPALEIPLPDGGKISVDGKIDRVDLMTRGNTKYVRIIDYKTGHKDFKLSDIIYGMNMQMLIYLAALSENGGKRYGNIQPAGVLYMPANRPSVLGQRGEARESLEKKAAKQLCMDGLVLDDAEVIQGMERNAAGEYIPVTLKNGKPAKKDHAVSADELNKVLNYTKNLIGGMARELRKGDVSAVPLSGGYDACQWCPYSAVCGHERDDSVREMRKKWDRDEVIAEFGKGDDSK